MKNIFILSCWMTLIIRASGQPPADMIPVLYGSISKEVLTESPYDKWFVDNYDRYQPDLDVINSIKKLNAKGISIQIFLGTWCGDSKREVPRFMKVLNVLGFSGNNVSIIGLGGIDSLYKQSPQKEEMGKGIFRVPVFIVYRNNVEINRINEYAAISLEKDLYAILADKSYTPNYRSFGIIKNWLFNGTLTDRNSSIRGLAGQLRMLIDGENELNSLGYVLLRQGKKEEALKIFHVNSMLFPESSNVMSSLGEAYYQNGDSNNAVQWLENALKLNKDPQLVKEILKILYEVKGLKG